MEPVHIHVRKGEAVAKFWLEPDIAVAEDYGMSASELRELIGAVKENKLLIERYWNEYFDL